MRSICAYFIGGPLDLTKAVLQSEAQREVFVAEQLLFSREQAERDLGETMSRALPRHRYLQEGYALPIPEPAGRRTYLYLYSGVQP